MSYARRQGLSHSPSTRPATRDRSACPALHAVGGLPPEPGRDSQSVFAAASPSEAMPTATWSAHLHCWSSEARSPSRSADTCAWFWWIWG